MKVYILVAADEKNGIGKDGQLLWHLPNDLKYFKGLTWGMPVIMGRKTFESVNKPLPGRHNIVLTHQKEWHHEGVTVVHTWEDALKAAESIDAKEVFVIGGGDLYRQRIDEADRIYITRVHTTLEADTFFPAINEQRFARISAKRFEADEKHAYPYTFEIWERKIALPK